MRRYDMRFSATERAGRRGAIAPLFGLLLIPVLGMMAFAIDTGYMCQAKTELQNAADSAALAGAQALQKYYVQYNLPDQTQKSQIVTNAQAAATALAKQFAAANTAGGVNIQLQDSDITFGFLDGQGNYTPPAPAFPNSIVVVARRDSTKNGSLPL